MAKVGSGTSDQAMAASAAISSSFLPLPAIASLHHSQNHQLYFLHNNPTLRTSSRSQKRLVFKVQAAKLPAGVELPKEVPKFQPPFLGFTRTAEIWNSRTCMVGLIGIFIVELILNRGILQIIGVEVGKGLNLPL
ncbi:light-harvesting complex-like protein OHP1, chloroplastic [Coffea arabica]|uniref:Light-harvesting complex-like protein OHP1, chloroplastic n=1 Tax=Coffea arabica TaxID=13443 RepID=A0A6P6T2H5_COFAR|nr:light-harvesting complex-like protein OHP1, chloroplastic [Coffea arabica]